ncbi:MAG TPA: hypothetical protein DHW39_07890 [Erysipelotrichaceae bacterium]|nr:hypothetical protein [Erysipelotrichaceae bacterium]
MNTKDLRYIKTEELIRSAFLNLAERTTIENIHIKDICAEAKISRNAFYGHYESKYELLERICKDASENMLSSLTEETVQNLRENLMYGVTEWCIQVVYEHRDLMRVLSKSSPAHFQKIIRYVFIESTLKELYTGTENIQKNIILKMSEAYISDALTSIIQIWLEDPSTISVRDLAKFLHSISHHAAAFFYAKLDENKNIKRRK